VSIGDQSRSWSDAKSTCETLQAELAYYKDNGEKVILERSLRGNINSLFWLGGTRRVSDGAWVWSDLKTYIPASLM
jgi:hypothetical protein